MTLAGLILKDNLDEDCSVAFLEDENCEVFTVNTNEEIVNLIEEFEPEILAVNVGMEQRKGDLTQGEEDLVDEGYSFTPNSHKVKLMKRLESLEAHLTKNLGPDSPEIIRFDPFISMEELAIESDKALEGFGIDTGDINSTQEFDAVVGAVTARFYEQNQFEDMDVIVPENP